MPASSKSPRRIALINMLLLAGLCGLQGRAAAQASAPAAAIDRKSVV